MKRKVIKQGHNTLTITLPSKWISSNNIKPGDELDINEDGTGIIINKVGNINKFKRTRLRLKSSYPRYIVSTLRNLYLDGYDQVEVELLNENDIIHVNEIVNYLIGYELIEQKGKLCIIKDITSEKNDEYEVLFRKIFLIIKQMGELLIDSFENGVTDANIVRMKDLDLTNSKFSCYCRRILYKNKMTFSDKGLANYIIINLAHMIGRNFHTVHKYMVKNNFKVKKETIEFAKEILSAFDSMYKYYYEPKNNNYQITSELLDGLVSKACGFISKDATHNSVIFYRLAEIARLIATTLPKIEIVTTFLDME